MNLKIALSLCVLMGFGGSVGCAHGGPDISSSSSSSSSSSPPSSSSSSTVDGPLNGPALLSVGDPLTDVTPALVQMPPADFAAIKGDEGRGNLAEVHWIRTRRDLTLYRAWSGFLPLFSPQHRSNDFSPWWSASVPGPTKDQVRKDYMICRDWNRFSYVKRCTLKAGAVVAVGPGQSVACGEGRETLPASGLWQVYVPNAWQRSDWSSCEDAYTDTENIEHLEFHSLSSVPVRDAPAP